MDSKLDDQICVVVFPLEQAPGSFIMFEWLDPSTKVGYVLKESFKYYINHVNKNVDENEAYYISPKKFPEFQLSIDLTIGKLSRDSCMFSGRMSHDSSGKTHPCPERILHLVLKKL